MNDLLKTAPIAVSDDATEEASSFEDIHLPEPPAEKSREERERDHAVDRIDDELTFACRDDDACYHGSTAFAVLRDQLQHREPLPITRQQATRLRSRLQLVSDALLPYFADTERKRVVDGLKAAESLVTWWALSKDQRKGQSPYALRQHRLRARWLQNALHNISIIEELEDSAVARRGKIISTLKGSSE